MESTIKIYRGYQNNEIEWKYVRQILIEAQGEMVKQQL